MFRRNAMKSKSRHTQKRMPRPRRRSARGAMAQYVRLVMLVLMASFIFVAAHFMGIFEGSLLMVDVDIGAAKLRDVESKGKPAQRTANAKQNQNQNVPDAAAANNNNKNEDEGYEYVTLTIHNGTIALFLQALECDQYLGKTAPKRPVTSDATWMQLRQTYVDIVGTTNSTIPANLTGTGFHVPYYVDYHPRMGRGIYATRSIPNNTLIWTEDYTAHFTQGWQFRKFLMQVPPDIACDLMIWSYAIHDGSGSGAIVCSDLDAGSLLNEGSRRSEVNTVERNVEGGRGVYSMRAIDAGEQILMNYNDFDFDQGWALLGL